VSPVSGRRTGPAPAARPDPVAPRPDAAAAARARSVLAITAGLHLWRRNAVLSILGGTASYVALASTLLAR